MQVGNAGGGFTFVGCSSSGGGACYLPSTTSYTCSYADTNIVFQVNSGTQFTVGTTGDAGSSYAPEFSCTVTIKASTGVTATYTATARINPESPL